jgi:S-adenosylmethionine hydrolase
METEVKIDVATLDAPHRRALEEVIGRQLEANQRVVISVTEPVASQDDVPRPVQTLDDWTNVYEGLSDQEIEAIDQVAKTRANLTRNLP